MMEIRQEFALEPGEAIIREVRIHWFFFLLRLIPYVILAFLPLLIPVAITAVGPVIAPYAHFTGLSTPLTRLALGLWWLIVWSAGFNVFTSYFLNVWVLTNHRIVEIEQRGFFNREVSSLLLDRVQDVTIDSEGLISSLLHIGDINVQTAGTIDRFTMNNVPQPEELRDIILQHVARAPAVLP